MTDRPNIAALEALLAKATPGQWEPCGEMRIMGGEKGYDDVVAPADVDCMTYCYGGSSQIEYGEFDREAIVALRNAAPALLRLVRAAQQIGPLEAVAETWATNEDICDAEAWAFNEALAALDFTEEANDE